MLSFKKFDWADEVFEEVEVIESDGVGPRLYVTPDNKKLPSMTSVLSILDDGGIDKWIERVGQEEADRITKEASVRGNALHDYCEKYLKNILDRKELSGQAKILFNRIKKYLDLIEIVIGTEVPLWNIKEGYAGRSDCIAVVEDKINIIDFKNSRNPIDLNLNWNRKKLFGYQLQCVGYARALKEMKGYGAEQGRIIVGNHLTSTADMFIFDLTDSFFNDEFDTVLECYLNNDVETLKRESLYFKL